MLSTNCSKVKWMLQNSLGGLLAKQIVNAKKYTSHTNYIFNVPPYETTFKLKQSNFDILLTVHLSIFISVFNQLDAQNLFYNKFYFMPVHVLSTSAHHQEVKIALHSLWYHHTYICTSWVSPLSTCARDSYCDDTRGCVMQLWPLDDEQMCSKHVEAWNKTYCKTNFVHQVG